MVRPRMVLLLGCALLASVAAYLQPGETQQGEMTGQPTWDSSKWECKQEVAIDNTGGASDLTDYQVKVKLTQEQFDFDDAAENGTDLRFADSDGATLLDYWLESFSKSERSAVAWVRVPEIPARSTKSIHLFYGNPDAPPASDGEATFEFFDDCESGSAEESWEVALGSPSFSYVPYSEEFGHVGGVWHASGARTRVSPAANTVYGGAHATYCAWTRPMAVYVPSQEKTFFAFGNEDNSPTVSYYDHRTKTLGPATIVGPNPDMDAHKNPHMLIDEEGYIYIFHGSHCSPTLVKRSAGPYDTSEWAEMATIEDSTSYPQPWLLRPGEITVLFRKGGTHNAAESYVKSTDGGATWSERVDIVTTPPKNGCYAVSIAETGAYPRKVHMAWSVTRGDWWQRYHVWYAYSDDGGETWRRANGTAYELPILEETGEMVFESDVPDRGVWLKDIQLDSQDKPYILFIDGNTLTYDCVWRLAEYSDGRWNIYEVAPSQHMYDGGALVILADDDFRVYAPTTPSQPYQDGGEIDEWQSIDGGRTWKKTRQLTSGSEFCHNHVKTVFNHGRGDFRVFWNYGDAVNPPSSRDVALYFYGEDQAEPHKMALQYAAMEGLGRLLKVAQPEKISSVLTVKSLSLRDVALDVRARTGPPERQHPMLCLGVTDEGHFDGAGLSHGRVSKIWKHTESFTLLGEGTPKPPAAWHEWSFRACGDSLRLVVDDDELLTVSDAGGAAGAVGARVYKSTFYLDDIRARKCAHPEPTAALQAPTRADD